MLRESIASESVDLIYLDPPFNSNANYNVLFKAPSGEGSAAQIEAFEDTWHWTTEGSENAYDEVIKGPNSTASMMMRAMRDALGDSDMMAYLAMMAVRLLELHRVLRPTGSLYLHCDPTASHYLKLLLDAIFGPDCFQNEIIWQRTSSANNARRWGPVHDVLLFYTKSKIFAWNTVLQDFSESYVSGKYKYKDSRGTYRLSDLTAAGTRTGDSGQPWKGFDPNATGRHWAVPTKAVEIAGGDPNSTSQAKLDALDANDFIYWTPGVGGKPGFPQFKRHLSSGQPIQDVITDIPPVNSMAKERLGYPTQKPVELLERILNASSRPTDVILDPFCGCGTAIYAAQKLGRAWVGIDVTHLAISLVERRLKEAFPTLIYDVIGVPNDMAGARDLAARDKHEFQKWITSKVGAQPYKGGKKGMDRGVDGYLHFRDANQKSQFAVVSVKGGVTNPGHVRDLKGTVEREKAAMGLFLSLNEPTREMEREAASAGFYETGGMKFPRVQILTAAQVLDGRRVQVPFGFTDGFKKAAREKSNTQTTLL